MESSLSKSSDDFNYSGSLEDLLAEQRAAVERALAFNQVIAERVAAETTFKKTEDNKSAQLTKSTPKSVTDVTDSTLTEPLIGKDDGSIRIKDIDTSVDILGPVGSAPLKAFSRVDVSPKATSHMSGHMFPTLEGVKEHVDKALKKSDAEDEDHYAKTGFWPRLARHPWFANATLLVIIANTIWIAYDTDHNDADLLMEAKIQFQVAGHFFCGFFTIELLVRFFAFRSKWYAILDYWFAFEMFLVALMIWETWIESLLYLEGYAPMGGGGRSASVLRICRIFRLLRVARTGRVLNAVPELMILARGMFAGVRSVMVTLTLLALIIYIFAIVFTQLLAGTSFDLENDSNFGSVPVSANFLLLQVLAGFDPDFANKLLAFMPLGYLMLLVYVLLGSLTIMNMLIGILCDVVFSVANDEKEVREEHEMESKLDHLAEDIDVSKNSVVSRIDFNTQIHKPDVIQQFSDLGVDVAGLIDFAHFVFQENEQLSYKRFEHMVIQFTGSKQASVIDIMNMRKQMSEQMSKVMQAYESSHEFAMTLFNKLDNMMDGMLEGYEKPDGEAKAKGRSLSSNGGNKTKESPVQVTDCATSQHQVPPVKSREVNAPVSRPFSLVHTIPKSEANAPSSQPSSISPSRTVIKIEQNAPSPRPASISPSCGIPKIEASTPGSWPSSNTPPSRAPLSNPGSWIGPPQASTPPTPPRRFAYRPGLSPPASGFRSVEVDNSTQATSSSFAAASLASPAMRLRDFSPSTAEMYRRTRDSPSTAAMYPKTRETKAAAENFAKALAEGRSSLASPPAKPLGGVP